MAVVPYSYGPFCINDGQNYFLLSKTLDSPTLQYQVQGVARVPGVKRNGFLINERPIQVTVRVIGSSRLDLETKLDALFGALQYRAQPLTLHASDSRYYLCDCSDAKYTLANGAVVWTDVQMTFTAYQPYAYSAGTTVYNLASAALTLQSTGVYVTPVFSMQGGGNVFTYPTIVITNTAATAITQLSVIQSTDAMTTTVIQTLNNGDTLTITSDPLQANGLTVQYNGGNPIAFQGSFPVMEPATTAWQISAHAASAPSLKAVLTWQSRWAT
jgi:phage-related protein